jgi:hypothetical protein
MASAEVKVVWTMASIGSSAPSASQVGDVVLDVAADLGHRLIGRSVVVLHEAPELFGGDLGRFRMMVSRLIKTSFLGWFPSWIAGP